MEFYFFYYLPIILLFFILLLFLLFILIINKIINIKFHVALITNLLILNKNNKQKWINI